MYYEEDGSNEPVIESNIHLYPQAHLNSYAQADPLLLNARFDSESDSRPNAVVKTNPLDLLSEPFDSQRVQVPECIDLLDGSDIDSELEEPAYSGDDFIDSTKFESLPPPVSTTPATSPSFDAVNRFFHPNKLFTPGPSVKTTRGIRNRFIHPHI